MSGDEHDKPKSGEHDAPPPVEPGPDEAPRNDTAADVGTLIEGTANRVLDEAARLDRLEDARKRDRAALDNLAGSIAGGEAACKGSEADSQHGFLADENNDIVSFTRGNSSLAVRRTDKGGARLEGRGDESK